MDWKSSRIEAIIEQALTEDRAVNDATTLLTIDPALRATGTVLARQDMIVCGLPIIPIVFDVFTRLSPQSQTRYEVVSHPEIFDGVRVRDMQPLAVIRHNARALLSCERVILNLMQHLSGISTLTRRYVDTLAGTNARVLDTRKTVPGLRTLEKYAVLTGGGTNHRLDLADGILIKNNHISLGGGVIRTLENALANRKPSQRVQIEVRTPQELEDALNNGAEAILLDNMTPAEIATSVEQIKAYASAHNRTIPSEASGGIVLENIRSYAETGVDFISVGALTHSAKAADISLRILADKN